MLWLAVGVCSFIVALVVVGLVVNSRNSKNAPATATSTATPAVTPVVATPAPLAPTPAPPAAVPPGMVTLQAGTFWLGCADGVDTQCDANEKPGHEIQVKLFSMMTREVTVAEYEKCVTVGVCTRPRSHKDRRCNWGANNREQHPMNCVSLADAQAYCHWRGGRLPTTIEWERAARGADKRIYPWGNNPATCSLAVIDDCHSSGTLPVGSRPSGATPEGLLDMAGNVYEWTQEGEARGGGWASGATKVRASRRVTTVKRDAAEADLGFRCAAGL
jgi:formylglycine-generating enzyme required for sulfatase activity